MNVKEMIELRRKYNLMRRELKAVEQELCGAETGHNFRGYVEWGHSGKECSRCGHRIKENCHVVGCTCPLKHG